MEVPVHWRLKKQRYKLVGDICPNCKKPEFPPRAVCTTCGGDTKKEITPTNSDDAAVGVLIVTASNTFGK